MAITETNTEYTITEDGEYSYNGTTTTTGQGFIQATNKTTGAMYNNFVYGFNSVYPHVYFHAKKGDVIQFSFGGSVTRSSLKKLT